MSVPVRSRTLKCSWKQVDGSFKWIDFETMLNVLDFSLEQAVFNQHEGRHLDQAG